LLLGAVASPSVKVVSSSLHLNNDNTYVPIIGGNLVTSFARVLAFKEKLETESRSDRKIYKLITLKVKYFQKSVSIV
jgi:predicted RNA methylase